jgi:predicted phage terminase large subunit-like protein
MSWLKNPTLLLADVNAELARRSLYEFVKQAWSFVEPAEPYRDNWHVRAVCEHLEAVSRGWIKNLVVNIPPGHLKSTLVSVCWPAWIWTWRPEWRGIFSSYALDLATRDATRTRTLMDSEWYQSSFVHGRGPGGKPLWRFSDDMNRKDMYTNTRTGLRMSIGVGSKATGFRGNAVVVDDPLNAKDAPSKLARDEVIYWWDKVMSSRVNVPERDAFVIIMQRLHEDDLTGHVLRQGGYEHLCLPSEFDPRRRTVTRARGEEFFRDPRAEAGELLFPEMFTPAVLAQAKHRLGADGYAGQHEQNPTAAEGGAFKYAWWRFFRSSLYGGSAPRPRLCSDAPAVELPAKLPLVIGTVDCAFKDRDENDYVAAGIIGAEGANRYLLHRTKKHLDFTATCKELLELQKRFPRVRKWLVEDKANGPAVVTALRGKLPGIVEVTPDGGKEARAAACSPQVEAGQVLLPEGAEWVEDFVDECAAFPRGRHDDQVDMLSQGLNYLTNPDGLRLLNLISNV